MLYASWPLFLFLSARPVRAATSSGHPLPAACFCFYPRDPCGPRPVNLASPPDSHRFYPRDPCGPRPWEEYLSRRHELVSIRATRAGRDTYQPVTSSAGLCFYPRDPCGPRPRQAVLAQHDAEFLSARPVRAATRLLVNIPPGAMFLSARPVRAATGCEIPRARAVRVSIRATRAGRDHSTSSMAACSSEFLSARPVRAATRARRCRHRPGPVSIRATRAGRDHGD